MRKPRAEIVCVGTELLAGKVNTHAAYLSVLLRAAGLDVPRETTAADSEDEIRDAVAEAASRCEVVLVCGGLGPTFDDLTREGAAAALGRPLRYDPALFEAIRRRFFRYRMKVPALNKRQAWVLEGARILPNGRGSAPGQLISFSGKTVALFPGPFIELQPMFEGQVLPILKKRYGTGRPAALGVFRFCGIGEAAAEERLSPLLRAAGGGVQYTILASPSLVELHAAAKDERLLSKVRAAVARLMGPHFYGEEEDTLESVLGQKLRKARLTLAAAESCTGGLLSAKLTSAAGSSDYFLGGVVAYDNRVKEGVLGVRGETLRRFGAVSAQCAREMAEGARTSLGAAIGVSLTGIAGPGGGTRGKPVGLVHIAWAYPGKTSARRFHFPGDRSSVRERAAIAALYGLYNSL